MPSGLFGNPTPLELDEFDDTPPGPTDLDEEAFSDDEESGPDCLGIATLGSEVRDGLVGALSSHAIRSPVDNPHTTNTMRRIMVPVSSSDSR